MNPPQTPATIRTTRRRFLHELNELTRQMNPKWRRTSRNYKTTIPRSGKNEVAKLSLVSSVIVRRSRNYRVRGVRGTTRTYFVSLWNVGWLSWSRIGFVLWAPIMASFGRKKGNTCLKRIKKWQREKACPENLWCLISRKFSVFDPLTTQ